MEVAMQELVLKMYFEENKKQIEIAKELNISKYKVSRIVTKDYRYKEEKERRKLNNKKKHKDKTKKYIAQVRKSQNNDIEYARLKIEHEQASRELSGGKKSISNRAFRNWNSSVYKYDSKSKSYILRKEIITGSDVPKRINWKGF
jgi:hypothetical protein